MERFFTIMFGFPTVLWSGLLLFCLLYWAVALIGFADFDAPEVDPELSDGGLEGIAGVLASIGLDGVPLAVALTAISLSGWIISYFLDLWLIAPDASGLWATLGAILILIGSMALSLKPATWLIRPLKPLFKSNKACNHDALGKTGTVIYAISPNSGVLDCTVNGAYLRLEARSSYEIPAGEKAVVIKYHKQDAVYQVVPEADFMTGLTR
jgi:membrane protein implicated in regulation of membrane protease activity